MIDIKEYLKQTKTVLLTQDAFDELMQRASAQPEPCGDVVSRNAIVQKLNEMDRYVSTELRLCDTDKKFPQNEVFIVDDVYEEIVEQLPSAQPEKRTENTRKTHGVCLDTISRQAAIDAHYEYCNKHPDAGFPAWSLKILEDLPPAQPETHEERTETHACDCISRQAAIEAIRASTQKYTGFMEMEMYIDDDAVEAIINLPSVQPDSKETSYTHKALDTISRQAAINALTSHIMPHNNEDGTVTIGVLSKSSIKNILNKLPSAQPEHTNSCYTNSWCIDCKEYDTENKCCPRYNRVIKQTLDDAYRHGETEAEARFHAEIVRCKDCKHRIEHKHYGDLGESAYTCEGNMVGWILPDSFCSYAERRTDERSD